MKQSWKQIVEHRLKSCSLSSRHCVIHSLSLKHSLKYHGEKMTERNHHLRSSHSTRQGYRTSKLPMYNSYFLPATSASFHHYLFKQCLLSVSCLNSVVSNWCYKQNYPSGYTKTAFIRIFKIQKNKIKRLFMQYKPAIHTHTQKKNGYIYEGVRKECQEKDQLIFSPNRHQTLCILLPTYHITLSFYTLSNSVLFPFTIPKESIQSHMKLCPNWGCYDHRSLYASLSQNMFTNLLHLYSITCKSKETCCKRLSSF